MDSEPIGTIQPVEPARIHIREGFYDDMGDSLSWIDSMIGSQVSDDNPPEQGWASDEQEIATLVEDFITSDGIPAEVSDKAKKLHDSGHSHDALKTILESLDWLVI